MKIIVAEDETLLLSVISRKLRNEGHEVIECSDGFKAMKEIVRHYPDMVITDIMMPNKNGFEVINFIRERIRRRIPIMVVTCLENEADIEEAFSLGCDEYITKPFSMMEFVIRVNRLLKNRREPKGQDLVFESFKEYAEKYSMKEYDGKFQEGVDFRISEYSSNDFAILVLDHQDVINSDGFLIDMNRLKLKLESFGFRVSKMGIIHGLFNLHCHL